MMEPKARRPPERFKKWRERNALLFDDIPESECYGFEEFFDHRRYEPLRLLTQHCAEIPIEAPVGDDPYLDFLCKEPGTRPDVQRRKETNKALDFSVIKTTYNSWLRPAARGCLNIDRLVRNMNKMSLEAHSFANLHILRLLEAGQPLPKLDNAWFYSCCAAVSANSNRQHQLKDPAMRETKAVYDSCKPPGYRRPSSDFMHSLMSNLSTQMETETKNLMVTTLYGRLKRYLRHFGELNGEEAFSVLEALFKPEGESRHPYVLHLQSLFPTLPTAKALQADPRIAIPAMHTMLRHFEGAEPDKRTRLFSMLPTKRGFRASHIKICSSALREGARVALPPSGALGWTTRRSLVSKFVGETHKSKKGCIAPLLCHLLLSADIRDEDFMERKRHYWSALFEVEKFERGGRTFGCEMQLDGKAVSILMTRPKKTPPVPEQQEQKKKLKKSEDPSYDCKNLQLDSYDRVLGLDPGRRDLFVAVDRDGGVTRCSAKRFYHEAGYTRTQRTMRRQKRVVPTLFWFLAKQETWAPRTWLPNPGSEVGLCPTSPLRGWTAIPRSRAG
ncbi:g969 [Coccomyxa elongata]